MTKQTQPGKTSAKPAKISGQKKLHEQRKRIIDGKEVKPVLYDGRMVGHGTFIAGAVDDVLVRDHTTQKPLQFRSIGTVQ